MITAFELAGLHAAHAIWCVSDGNTLIPMLGYTTAANERKMNRFVNDTLESSVADGKEMLISNKMDADDAVLLYDGRITVGNQKLDAILIEIRTYMSPDSEAILAVPYSPKASFFSKFRVHKPKILSWENCDDFDLDAALESFFKGVDSHEKGSKIWNKHLDQSK